MPGVHVRTIGTGRPALRRNTPPGRPVVPTVEVEIWSDVVCPWCYIGKRRFEEALSRFPHAADVRVAWRAYELDPSAVSAPADDGLRGRHAAVLAAKLGTSEERAREMSGAVTATAAGEGLEYRFDLALPANTLDAHQVLHLAGQRGVQDAVAERLMRAHFTEGEALGDREVLVRLGAEAGLDAGEVRSVLAEGRLVDAVRADQAEAAALGARGVPFFVVDRRYGVSGAQPAEQLLAVLERAWAEGRSA